MVRREKAVVGIGQEEGGKTAEKDDSGQRGDGCRRKRYAQGGSAAGKGEMPMGRRTF